MTKQEELTYLFGILSEASKWLRNDDDRDLVRIEVEERIQKLINDVEPEPDENGIIQSSIHPDNPNTVTKPGEFVDTVEEPLNEDDFKALEAARLNEHLASPEKVWKAKERWKHGRVRVTINGKPVWKLESDCHKEIIPGFEKKWHWVWNGPEDKKIQEGVNKLSDELWEAHENGNDL